MEGGVWGERDRRTRGGGHGGEGSGAGVEISYQERLAPSPHFWRVYKVSTGFANMQRDGVILVSFVNKFGVGVGLGGVGWGRGGGGALAQMLLEHRFWIRFVYSLFFTNPGQICKGCRI